MKQAIYNDEMQLAGGRRKERGIICSPLYNRLARGLSEVEALNG